MEDGKSVFVTVGTTFFEGLVQAVMKRDVLETLFSQGYSSMEIQIGNGLFVPNEGIRHGIIITTFRFKDNIIENFKNADLVISHAGAGSCLEALSAEKPLVAVINETLMNNHQIELAEALAEEGNCHWCYSNNLYHTLDKFVPSKLKLYTKGNPEKLIDYIDSSFMMKND